MSIVSVDNIQPIGSGTTVTVNKSVTLESGNTNITGVCTATSFVGGLPITNGADNRVITASSASAIQGESNLTFDGNTLALDSNTGTINVSRNSRTLTLEGNYGNEGHPAIKTSSGHDLRIFTGGNNERLRITGAGLVGISTNAPSSALLDIATDSGSNDHLRLRRISSDSNIASNWSFKPYGGHLYFREGGSTDKIQFMNGGDIYILDGNLRVASGHGIDFAATADTSATGASASSELLDDYEEGSFTPYIDREHGSPIVGYDAQDGYYTKIGRVVYFYAEVRINSYNGNGSYGNTFLRGLPYNSAARTGGRGVWNSVQYNSYYRDIDTTDGERDIAVVQHTSEKVVFYVMRSENSWTAPPAPDANDQFKIGGFYFT